MATMNDAEYAGPGWSTPAELWPTAVTRGRNGWTKQPEDEMTNSLRIVTGDVEPPNQYHPKTRFVVLLMCGNEVVAAGEYVSRLNDAEMYHAIRKLTDSVSEDILALRKPYEDTQP